MQQKLSPQQLLLMKLLQLPSTRLEQRIKEEVENNPMLEIESEPPHTEESLDNNPTIDDGEGDFHGLDIDDYFDDDYSYRERLERDRNIDERHPDLVDPPSFTESLLDQLAMQPLSDRQRKICVELIGSIDASGYLRRDLQMIANDLAFRSDIDPSDDEMEQLLHIVQSFDPPGVAARSLQECLSLQLHRIPNPDPATSLATTIVDTLFPQLCNKRYDALLSALKVDESHLKQALDTIRHLNPKPGWGREDNRDAHFIIPDFIVFREGDNLSFVLNERNFSHLRISGHYSEMLLQLSSQKNLSPNERQTVSFIKEKDNAARTFIDSLEQRKITLSRTMQAILKYQYQYFISGNTSDLRPMKLKDISLATGLDESTISRVVNEKYVQCDFDTFLLKDLFSKAVVSDDGDVFAIDHLKKALKSIVDSEDKHHPLTDQALAEALKTKGFRLSRRTVSKYRESLNIPAARLRKNLHTL